MSKIFLTGGNGFLGQALSRRLLAKGHEVHTLIYHERNPKVFGVFPHIGDLMKFKQIERFLKQINPDFIIHLAARTEVEKSFYDPVDFSLINYGGTVNLIEKSRKLPNLKLFIFASTMETYGEVYNKYDVIDGSINLQPFNEETPQKPNAPYAVAKFACEYYLRYAGRAYNFPFVTLRQTNTYGRYDNDFFIVEQIISQMLKNSRQVKLGYKEPYRNFLYVDDLMDLYEIILADPEKAKGQFFCCGPNNAIRIEDLAKKIAEKLNWQGEILWDKKRKRVGEVYYLNSVADKVQAVLGWSPKTDLDTGLDKTIAVWRRELEKPQ